MATMVKEKRREKKKHKEKTMSKNGIEQEQPFLMSESRSSEQIHTTSNIVENVSNIAVEVMEHTPESFEEIVRDQSELGAQKESVTLNPELSFTSECSVVEDTNSSYEHLSPNISVKAENVKITEANKSDNESLQSRSFGNTYHDLNARLDRIVVREIGATMSVKELERRLENPQAYLRLEQESEQESLEIQENTQDIYSQESIEHAVPSAPVFEEEQTIKYCEQAQETIKLEKPKQQCMPLEEAVRIYGGKEMEQVGVMSEREEAIVEAGPMSGPDHPLVDLLSTFRSSLIAVDRERLNLSKGFVDEEKFRNNLWKIQKKTVNLSEDCPCGATVTLQATYEDAEFMKERLPVAKMKLEGLLRDVQDSYCHHQHQALLTHCQIEELIMETIKSNKKEIREALALVLQALRLSDNAPSALGIALQRWAGVLSAALLDGRDLSQLLHLLHHLFRQTRSVRWAARTVRSYIRAGDRSEAAQATGVLQLLVARPRLDKAAEISEDMEDWEEMDKSGGSGAVSEGSLRERDLLALLQAFPARELIARIVLFTHADISKAREYEWGDRSGGSGVLKACCGVRTLLYTLHQGVMTHPTYTKLHKELKSYAATALNALAGLHLHAKDYYSKDLEEKIYAELEACFCAGFELLGPEQIAEVPTTLLSDATAREYCCVNILGLHDKTPKQLDFLLIRVPVMECGARVRVVSQAALHRRHDHELARTILDFLLQTGIKRKPVPCKGTCEATARELLPRILATHPYLHTIALHTLAEYHQVEPIDPSSIDPLSPYWWRPTPGETRQVLEDWATRCPTLLQHLLTKLDYSPPAGVSLEAQLTIGSWLCHWLKQDPKRPLPPEWAWLVLQRLRVHRSYWGMVMDAPPPDPPPDDMFSMAYAVLASSWGHCVPLICSEGVAALCKLAASRPADAVHCLGPIMLIMAASPQSVSLTPKFEELFGVLLKSGPTLVQRALGLGPEPGADSLLRLILKQIEGSHPGVSRSSLLSAWLHAIWRPSLPSSAQLDTILLACRDWALFDAHATSILQDKHASELLASSVRNVSVAPMVCECVLRNAHGSVEVRAGWHVRLLDALHSMRVSGDRIHVDNALKLIGANMSSEELVIYRCATALQSAPEQRPQHLTLWTLFMHLYLQRAPAAMSDTAPPVGPLFFSGLIKSRVLAQLRKKLQETIIYHHNEAETLKQNNREETPIAPSRSTKERQNSIEDGVVPTLSIRDLTGESSEDSDSASEIEDCEKDMPAEGVEKKKDMVLLVQYHAAAESMCKEFLRWIDEGDKTRAMPHHADIARFLPEQVLGAAWARELTLRRPASLPEDPSPPPRPPPLQTTPFEDTVAAILSIKDCSRRRPRRLSLKSPLEDKDLRNPRSLLSLVDKYLADIEQLAQEWCKEVNTLSSLDSALWELVCKLRVRRPLPPVRKQCAHLCKPLTIHIPHQEWCISTGTERGIEENRRRSRSLIRRLARPRPHAAQSAAALISIARRVGSVETAVRVCERVWRCARSSVACTPAHAAITALAEILADRWLSQDGKICADFLTRWGNDCNSSLQQALCGTLVAPRRLPAQQWPNVYCSLLRSKLPPDIAFSCLSKFEMSRWVRAGEPGQRRELLKALASTAQRWGSHPEQEAQVLLELIGVHTATLLDAPELCAHIIRCSQASVSSALPATYWSHVTLAAAGLASSVPFDQLGHLLRQLGVMWWEARTSCKSSKISQYVTYAPHIADILHVLLRAFAASAVALSYAPERVALYVWSALQESWAAWVTPSVGAPSLLTGEAHTDMLQRYQRTILQLLVDCPGLEEPLLQQIFEWAVQTFFSVHQSTEECRLQLTSLMVQLGTLPWTEHQWFRPTGLQYTLQVCASNNKEIQSWCSDIWRDILAQTWVRGAPDDQLSPLLASLLYLFTAMPHHTQTLEQATRLPWWRLPEAASEEALERFFLQYHNPNQPYHDLPQFRVIISASELVILSNPGLGARARHKRAACISRWVCAACSPHLHQHVTAHTDRLLELIATAAPYLEGSEGELEELLGRALAIMCMEPAAAAALPVWCKWIVSAPASVLRACVSAISILTAFEYFAPLADVALRAHCVSAECGGWGDIVPRMRASPWQAAGALVARGRLHAAYAVARTHAHTHAMMQTALLALLAAPINFKENEAIVAVWICLACRIARSSGGSGASAECGAAARSVLNRWTEEPRRSILQMVTLQADSNTPTTQHRLLCRLACCLLSPSEGTVRSYEAACATVAGLSPDVVSWGKQPTPKHLPRLAIRLYPNAEKYFKDELEFAPEDS